MTGFMFAASCPSCGGDLVLLAPSTVRGRITQAMTKCSNRACSREHLVRVVLEPVARPESVRRRERPRLQAVSA